MSDMVVTGEGTGLTRSEICEVTRCVAPLSIMVASGGVQVVSG